MLRCIGTFRGIFVGIYVVVGVPLFAFTLGQFAGMIVEKAVREREMKIMSRPLGEHEFRFALTLKRTSTKTTRKRDFESRNNFDNENICSNGNDNDDDFHDGNDDGYRIVNNDVHGSFDKNHQQSSFAENPIESGRLLFRKFPATKNIPPMISRGRLRSYSESNISSNPAQSSKNIKKSTENEEENFTNFSIDFGEFVVLEMLRLCRVDQDDLKAIRSLFDDIDYDNSGRIDEKKLHRFGDLLHKTSEHETIRKVSNDDVIKEYDNRRSGSLELSATRNYSKINAENHFSPSISPPISISTSTSTSTAITINHFTVCELPSCAECDEGRVKSVSGAWIERLNPDPVMWTETMDRIQAGSDGGVAGIGTGIGVNKNYYEADGKFKTCLTGMKDTNLVIAGESERETATVEEEEEEEEEEREKSERKNDDFTTITVREHESIAASPLNSQNNGETRRLNLESNDIFSTKLSDGMDAQGSKDSVTSEGSHSPQNFLHSDEYNRLLMPILYMRGQSMSTFHSAAHRDSGRNSITPPGSRSGRQSISSDASDEATPSPEKRSLWDKIRGLELGVLVAAVGGRAAAAAISEGDEGKEEDGDSDDDDGGGLSNMLNNNYADGHQKNRGRARDRNSIDLNQTERQSGIESLSHPNHTDSSSSSSINDGHAAMAPNMLRSFGYSKYGSMNTIEEENI